MVYCLSRKNYQTVAIKNDGTLWAWGYNYFGQLGDGTTDNKNIPTQESTASTTWLTVSVAGYHAVAIKNDGTLWSWGDNGYGQLGNGIMGNNSIPTQEATANNDWDTISAGGVSYNIYQK